MFKVNLANNLFSNGCHDGDPFMIDGLETTKGS